MATHYFKLISNIERTKWHFDAKKLNQFRAGESSIVQNYTSMIKYHENIMNI